MLNKTVYFFTVVLLWAAGAAFCGQGVQPRSPIGRASAVIQIRPDEDFLVNDDTEGGCSQSSPVAASDSAGNFVIAWADQRNGSDGWDVYCQRFDESGNPLGLNCKVNEGKNKLSVSSADPVSIAMNSTGQYVIAWVDFQQYGSNQKQGVYFRIFDVVGNPVGSNQKANEDLGNITYAFPVTAMDETGGFAVAWLERSENYSYTFRFQRFDAYGRALGGNRQVNDTAGSVWGEPPAIGMDKTGKFVAAWTGNIRGGWGPDICFQRFDSSGQTLGPIQTANTDTGYAGQNSPAIAMIPEGGFVIAWEDTRNSSQGQEFDFYDIYFQRFDSSSTPMGSNQMANDDGEGAGQYHPVVAVDGAGRFAIAWHDNRGKTNYEIYYQRFDAEGNALDANRNADADGGTAPKTVPGIAMDETGGFVIAWEDARGGARNPDIYFRMFGPAGDPRDAARKANDDTGSTDQTRPAVAMDGKGGFIVAWTDERNAFQYPYATYDIYFQQYDAAGNPVGPNRQVNEVNGEAGRISDPTTPAVAADADGNFVIAWMDNRVHSWDIYCQRFDASGRPLGPNELVNDDNLYDANQRSPAVAMNSRGDYVIAWTDYPGGWDFGIRYQVFDAEGHRVGRSRAPQYGMYGDLPAVGMDESGRFAVAWWIDAYYYINGEETIISDVYVERFDAEGNSLGRSRKANDVAQGKRGGPSIAMNRSGEFVVAWQDGRDGDTDVFYQQYDSSGSTLGANQRANDIVGVVAPYSPAVAMDETGRFAVAWPDERFELNGPVLVGQRYYALGDKRGENYRMTFAESNCYPAAAANTEKIVYVWQDNRRSQGYDIFCKMVSWSWHGIDDGVKLSTDRGAAPRELELLPNYPNPFNPETVIPYRLSASGYVNLSIINMTGQCVRELVGQVQASGFHRIRWDGTDARGGKVNSGVYFCRMRMESGGEIYQATRKLCLVR
jgi:hypothetical protein